MATALAMLRMQGVLEQAPSLDDAIDLLLRQEGQAPQSVPNMANIMAEQEAVRAADAAEHGALTARVRRDDMATRLKRMQLMREFPWFEPSVIEVIFEAQVTLV